MKKRQLRRDSGNCEVILSPLIDCVFLLLIFFLVTSMIKRFERQIPVNLSDGTSAIKVQDRLEILGFKQVRFRIRDAALGNNSSELRDNR